MSSMDCGKFIAELRKDKRITQTELADLLKVSNSAISRWETGEGFPDISIFPRLAEILNVSVDELLKGHRIEKEQKMSLRKTNRKFKNASIGSIVILISAFLMFVAIAYSTYRVWYGVISFIVLSTIAIIWFILSRNEMIDECDYTDDDKHQIYKRTIIFYSFLIILFTMLIPQMVATTQSNIVTTVMSLDYYSFWLLLIGFLGLSMTMIFNLLHNNQIHILSLKIPKFFGVQNLPKEYYETLVLDTQHEINLTFEKDYSYDVDYYVLDVKEAGIYYMVSNSTFNGCKVTDSFGIEYVLHNLNLEVGQYYLKVAVTYEYITNLVIRISFLEHS
jgi:transcriptional regulator with XRE-family HTH domain